MAPQRTTRPEHAGDEADVQHGGTRHTLAIAAFGRRPAPPLVASQSATLAEDTTMKPRLMLVLRFDGGGRSSLLYFPCSSLALCVWKSAAFSESVASLSASFASASQCFCIFWFQGFFAPPFASG